MTAAELFDIVKERGLTIRVNDNGQAVVSGSPERMTPALVAALKTHRAEIITFLGFGTKPVKPVQCEIAPDTECLWPGNGYVGPHYFPGLGYPVGAFFFRKIGETDWQPIPGRTWNEETKRGHVERKAKS